MSVSRRFDAWRERYTERGARVLHSMLSAVAIVAYEAREVIGYQGREAADGSVDADLAEQYGVIGLAARPPEGHGRAILAHLGGEAGHAVVIACKDDGTRAAIIDAAGLAWDEVIVHNSRAMVKITKDGEILIGHPGDPAAFEPLVRRSEFVGHTHGPGSFVGYSSTPVQGQSGGAGHVQGSKYIKAQ